jgi:hypothetical protein
VAIQRRRLSRNPLDRHASLAMTVRSIEPTSA